MSNINRSIETIPNTTPSTVETPSKGVNQSEVPVKETDANNNVI